MVEVRLSPLETFPVVSLGERRCPRCGSTQVHSHGWRTRPLRDWAHRKVQARRLRCTACGATWTVYPQGVSPGGRFSVRAEQFIVLWWL